jgi:hypothetical protein
MAERVLFVPLCSLPAGDWVQWYSGGSYFDFANQTFEYANDIALPTNATGAFAPFNGSMNLVPFYGDGVGIDIPHQPVWFGTRAVRAGNAERHNGHRVRSTD